MRTILYKNKRTHMLDNIIAEFLLNAGKLKLINVKPDAYWSPMLMKPTMMVVSQAAYKTFLKVLK